MRKVDDREKKKKKRKEKKEKEKIMTFIVATNIVASRPPERRPTGTPYARAKKENTLFDQKHRLNFSKKIIQAIELF